MSKKQIHLDELLSKQAKLVQPLLLETEVPYNGSDFCTPIFASCTPFCECREMIEHPIRSADIAATIKKTKKLLLKKILG